jgi:hypothetical protein
MGQIVTIRGGASFRSLDEDDVRNILDARERQRARGIKWMEYAFPLGTSPANQITAGPDQGYMWSVRIVSSTLGSAGTLTIYKCSAQPGLSSSGTDTRRLLAFLGTSQTAQAQQFPSDTCVLRHGEALLLVASTTLTNYYLGGWEAIQEQQWKLMD